MAGSLLQEHVQLQASPLVGIPGAVVLLKRHLALQSPWM